MDVEFQPWLITICLLDNFLGVESMDLRDDVVQRIFNCEMTRIEPMHFCFGQILQVSFTAFAREEDVLLAPENDGVRLAISQEFLPLGIQSYVRSIVVEEI